MNISRVLAATALCFAGLLLNGALCQRNKEKFEFELTPLDLSNQLNEASFTITNGDQLGEREPFLDTVEKGEHKRVHIELPTKGVIYPNILLTLTTTNFFGDADIVCVPGRFLDIKAVKDTEWRSDHSQGADYIYISTLHAQYEAAKVNITVGGEEVPGISIQCAVNGHAIEGTDFDLQAEVSYNPVSIATAEKEAITSIFKKCCRPGSCSLWGGNLTRGGTPSMNYCNSPGSFCKKGGHLVRLDLSAQFLDCPFPIDELAELKYLEKLELDGNLLEGDIGTIAKRLATDLPSLTFLSMIDTGVSGSIDDPSVCHLTHNGSLEYLDLRGNKLSGPIPECLLDESSSLKEVFIGENALRGSLPPLPSTSKLQVLSISLAGLTGSIEPSLASLPNLKTLDLSYNELSGVLPSTFVSSPSLRRLYLEHNLLRGSVPGSIATSASLSYVHLGENSFSGLDNEWISSDMSNSNLLFLEMSRNEIQAPFPSAVAKAPKLQSLGLMSNRFSGDLPDMPGMFSNLARFRVRGNRLSGNIPESLSDIGFLNPKVVRRTLVLMTDSEFTPVLDLAFNAFTGPVPEFFSARSVPKVMHGRVFIGGNNLNVPCPLPRDFVHIVDLECKESGASDAGEAPHTLVSQQSHDNSKTRMRVSESRGNSKSSFSIHSTPAIVLLVIIGVLLLSNIAVILLFRRRLINRRRIDELVGKDVQLGSRSNAGSAAV